MATISRNTSLCIAIFVASGSSLLVCTIFSQIFPQFYGIKHLLLRNLKSIVMFILAEMCLNSLSVKDGQNMLFILIVMRHDFHDNIEE